MSDWILRRRYGFGVARIALEAEMLRHPLAPEGVVAGVRRAIREFGGARPVLRHMLVNSPFALLGMIVVLAVFLQALNPKQEQSGVQIVMLEPPVPQALPEPEPVVEPPKPEPPPPVAKPKPKPPPVEVAQAPKPRPKPKPPAPPPKKVRKRPEIKIDQIAKQEPKPTPKLERRRLAEAPREEARRQRSVQPVAALQKSPAPAPLPKQQRRAAPRPETQRRSAPLPALAAVAPELPSDAPAPRAQRFKPVASQKSAKPRKVAALPVAQPALPDVTEPARTTRRAAPSAESRKKPAARPPRFEPAGLPAPSTKPAPASPRSTRQAPTRTPRRDSSAKVAGALAVPGMSAPNTQPVQVASSRQSTRVSERAGVASRSQSSRGSPALSGVPLGSLAACVTDRQEDSLKRELVATVTSQKECVSAAGTYRFVETKNLNAFLMWIERAPGRSEADRCAELQYALDCVLRQKGRGR